MKKLSTLLLISLLNIPSFAYATENSSIKEKAEKIETKENSSSNDFNFFLKVGSNRYNFNHDIMNSFNTKFKIQGLNINLGKKISNTIDADIGVLTFEDIIKNKTETDPITHVITKTNNTFSNNLLLTNGYFNIKTKSSFKPYLTAGLGVAIVEVNKNISVSNTTEAKTNKYANTNFAWDIGIGFTSPISDTILFDMNSKFYNLGKLKLEQENISIKLNNISVWIKVAI